jgi:hypothetical protein
MTLTCVSYILHSLLNKSQAEPGGVHDSLEYSGQPESSFSLEKVNNCSTAHIPLRLAQSWPF